jgi:protein phosphatase/serine/threonine-protein phosphatase Stp1
MLTCCRASAASDPGCRAWNEDAWVSRPDLGLWAVADGAGGHEDGAAASRAVTAALETIPPGLTAAEMLAQVRLRLDAVHAALIGQNAASTAVVLIVRGAHCACLWAGDSRAYRLRDGNLDQLTRDHSAVQALLDARAISPADAATHPEAHVITRAVGGGGDVLALDKVIERVMVRDRFLLCSDGLSRTLPHAELARCLAGDMTAGSLIAAALRGRPSDNVTAVTIEVVGEPITLVP